MEGVLRLHIFNLQWIKFLPLPKALCVIIVNVYQCPLMAIEETWLVFEVFRAMKLWEIFVLQFQRCERLEELMEIWKLSWGALQHQNGILMRSKKKKSISLFICEFAHLHAYYALHSSTYEIWNFYGIHIVWIFPQFNVEILYISTIFLIYMLEQWSFTIYTPAK